MKVIIPQKIVLIIVAACCYLPSASADIWKCHDRFLTQKNQPAVHCRPIAASVLCGSDGNKYITPSNPDYPVVSQYCKSKNSKNIFGSKEYNSQKFAGELNKRSSYEERKLKPARSSGKKSQENLASKLAGKGPHEILAELFKNPESIQDLAKLAFPSLQEDFSE